MTCHIALQLSFMGFLVFFFGASCTAGTLKWMRHKVLCPRQIISMITWRDILRKWFDDEESLWRCLLAAFFEPATKSRSKWQNHCWTDYSTWSSFLYIYEYSEYMKDLMLKMLRCSWFQRSTSGIWKPMEWLRAWPGTGVNLSINTYQLHINTW